MKRPFLLYILYLLLAFLALGSLAGGGMLILIPDGSSLGMAANWLDGSPFKSYLIPGLILFTTAGLFPSFALVGLILKPDWKWANLLNIYTNRHWAWTYALYSGIIAIIWIIVQQVMTYYFWLQPAMIFTGLGIIITVMTPAVIKEFKTPGR
jgi:hypothetical protein